MATMHSEPCSLELTCFVFKRCLTALWLLCLIVGGQIAAEAPHKHSLRIEAHNCTKCVNVFSKPIAYIGFQLHRMLEEFKFKVTSHSPYAHHAQQALPLITHYMNLSLYYQKLYLKLETAGYYYLEVLCSESMWVFNTLLEGKVTSHSKHVKVPHDLWWTMSPCFEWKPFPTLETLVTELSSPNTDWGL